MDPSLMITVVMPVPLACEEDLTCDLDLACVEVLARRGN